MDNLEELKKKVIQLRLKKRTPEAINQMRKLKKMIVEQVSKRGNNGSK